MIFREIDVELIRYRRIIYTSFMDEGEMKLFEALR